MIEIEMVKIPGVTFKIGKYPVTQEQYEAVMGINPSYFINRPQNPVESVSYNDAIAFYQKLRKKTGKNYRLPTNSEWEYACRAGTETLFRIIFVENLSSFCILTIKTMAIKQP